MIEPINKNNAFLEIKKQLQKLRDVFDDVNYLEFSENYIFAIYHGSTEYTIDEYEKMKEMRLELLQK